MFDFFFYVGCYYVQEVLLMFVEQVFCCYVIIFVKMFDFCVVFGGKLIYVCSVLFEGSLLVVNEVICNCLQILVENLMKWGYVDVVVINNDFFDFFWIGFFFDVILMDVFCLGEGMFCKDFGVIEEWSFENVEICWQC